MIFFFFPCLFLNTVAGDIVSLTWVVAFELHLVHHAFSHTSVTHTVVRGVVAACFRYT